MKYFQFIIVLFSMVWFGYSQNRKFIDSISKNIKVEKSDSLKASIYYNAAGYSTRQLGNLDLCRLYTDSSMYYATASGHKDLQAKNHFLYGMIARIEGDYSKALHHLQKNIDHFENDLLMKPYALFQVAAIQRKNGQLEKSLSTYIEILDIFEINKDTMAIASALNSIAVLYGDMNDYDEAISNYTKARNLFVSIQEERDIANTDRNLSNVYLKKQDYINAVKYGESALHLAQKINHKDLIGRALQSLGNIYVLSDPNKGLEYMHKARKVLLETTYFRKIISVNSGLGETYFKLKQYSKAKIYFNEALVLSRKENVVTQIKTITKYLAEIHFNESNFEKAYKYKLEYDSIRDSLFNQETEKNIKLLQTRFETEKKDKEIVEQQLILEQQELEIQQKKNQAKLMTGLAIFLLIGSVLTWFLYKQRQKRKDQEIVSLKREQQVKTLELLMEGEEKERLRIAKELHDGVNVDLSSIKYKLTSMLEKNNEDINEAVAMIDRSCEQVRAISHDLVPPSLKDFSLADALKDFCITKNSMHTSEITCNIIGCETPILKKVQINIFRIIQELVNNSIKHSEASEINVQLSFQKNDIQVTVEDNGKGFKKEQVGRSGIGLQNINSRIEYLNARLDFTSDDKGTSYVIDINTDDLV